jgi:hypothetical protein
MNSVRELSAGGYLRVGLLIVAAFVIGVLTPFPQRGTHEGWEPPLEETSTRFLQDQAEEARRLLDAAREEIRSQTGDPEGQLSVAAQTLERMTLYYLPLLEARERAYDAHRLYYYGEEGRAAAHLDAIEGILDAMANAAPEIFLELKEPLDLVAEARAGLKATPDDVPRLLKTLAVRLNLMALKGNLLFPDEQTEVL